MKRPPEMTKRQFTAALQRNGFRQVLLWITDTTGQVPGTSWGMMMHHNGKMAYRASLAKVIRERNAAVERSEAISEKQHDIECTCEKCDPDGVYDIILTGSST
jgi:hypothetical protein